MPTAGQIVEADQRLDIGRRQSPRGQKQRGHQQRRIKREFEIANDSARFARAHQRQGHDERSPAGAANGAIIRGQSASTSPGQTQRQQGHAGHDQPVSVAEPFISVRRRGLRRKGRTRGIRDVRPVEQKAPADGPAGEAECNCRYREAKRRPHDACAKRLGGHVARQGQQQPAQGEQQRRVGQVGKDEQGRHCPGRVKRSPPKRTDDGLGYQPDGGQRIGHAEAVRLAEPHARQEHRIAARRQRHEQRGPRVGQVLQRAVERKGRDVVKPQVQHDQSDVQGERLANAGARQNDRQPARMILIPHMVDARLAARRKEMRHVHPRIDRVGPRQQPVDVDQQEQERKEQQHERREGDRRPAESAHTGRGSAWRRLNCERRVRTGESKWRRQSHSCGVSYSMQSSKATLAKTLTVSAKPAS